MSDADKWRNEAQRLAGLLDAWGIFPKPVAQMSNNEIMEVMYAKIGGRAPLPPADAYMPGPQTNDPPAQAEG